MDENKQQAIDNIANLVSQAGATISNIVSAFRQGQQNGNSKDVSISGNYSNGNSLPSWLLPVGGLVAGLAILFLIFKK